MEWPPDLRCVWLGLRETSAVNESRRMNRCNPVLVAIVCATFPSAIAQSSKLASIRTDIPSGGHLDPRQEEGVFAACSRQGMRVLVSRDDGTTWNQTLLATVITSFEARPAVTGNLPLHPGKTLPGTRGSRSPAKSIT